jgi:hypothetical protein
MHHRLLALLAFAAIAIGCAHGSASAAERQAVIEANLPELQACWASVADQHPGAAGSVLFSVTLRRNGSVDWVDVPVDEIGAPKLITCAVRRIKKWRFPEGRKQTLEFGVGFTAP